MIYAVIFALAVFFTQYPEPIVQKYEQPVKEGKGSGH